MVFSPEKVGLPAFLTLDKRVKAAIKRDVRDDIASRVRRQGPTSTFRNLRQVIEGGKSTQRAAPEATPTELNEYFVGVGPRVAAEVRDRGEPLHLPCRLPRVGALCLFLAAYLPSVSSLSPFFHEQIPPPLAPDGVSIRILKLCFGAIGHVLLYFVNTCLTTCDFPASWKHSIIHPIHKSGDTSQASNYRPISIVPAFAKLVEKVAQQQLYT